MTSVGTRTLGRTGPTASALGLGCMAQGEDVVPIPGTTRRGHLEEHVGALDVELPAGDPRLGEMAPPGVAVGGRHVDSSSAYGGSPERGAA